MNILAALTVILLIVAGVVVAVYMLGQFEQTKPFYDQIVNTVNPAFEQLKGFVATPTGTLTSIGGVTGLVTVAGAAYSKLSAAKQKLIQATETAKTQISTITDVKDKLTQQVSTYEKQITEQTSKIVDLQNQIKNVPDASGIKQKLTDTQNLLDASQLQKQEVQDQLKKLQIQYNELRSLMAVK